MKIAIIGGGFTGLTAAYELTKLGHTITVFERDTVLGGLALGWKETSWDWYLEKAYHHLFTNDDAIIGLIKDLGIGNNLIIKRPITANFYQGQMHQFDSATHLLRFPHLSLVDKVRTGALVAFCKAWPFWQPLEKITAKQFATHVGGKKAWTVVWEPLMTGKFSHLDGSIAASWLWARIHKRTPSLAYIEGGFQTVIAHLADACIAKGADIQTEASVQSIKSVSGGSVSVQVNGKHHEFDRVLLTVPTPIALNLLPKLPPSYTKPLLSIPHLHAQVMVLETDKPILDAVYWLSITDRSFPFLAVVAHTNFMNKKHYGGRHLTYVGNYLPPGHPYLTMTKGQLQKLFTPFVHKLNPTGTYKILATHLFTAPFAQPVHLRNYSHVAPTFVTPVPGVYLANMDSIYPWDRGTNYAVELGQNAAQTLSKYSTI